MYIFFKGEIKLHKKNKVKKKIIKIITTSLDYSRVEIGSVTRRRRVKLWLSTANPSQRSKWAEIGSPLGKKCRYKMNIINHILKKKVFFEKYSNFMIINCLKAPSAFFMNSSG